MGASWAMRRRRVAGAKRPALVPRRGMSSGFLARVRWSNVVVALVIVGVLGALVAWPALAPRAPVVAPPVAAVAPPVAATPAPTPTPTPTPTPAPTARPRPRRAAVKPARRARPERRRV